MPDSVQHSSSRGKSTLRVVYWVLGSISFLQLLAVGTILALNSSEKTSSSANNTPDQRMDSNHGKPTASVKKTSSSSQQDDEELLNSIRPRTIEEMLGEATSNGNTPPVSTNAGNVADTTVDETPPSSVSQPAQEALPSEGELSLSPSLAALLKESRYCQIEGDMKRSILKLEEANALEPSNPVVLYYFGLAYESIRNADKSREYFLKVVTMREKAGKYFALAAKHLETGFASPADRRGDVAFGTILEYKEPDSGEGERVVLSIPILMKDGLNIRPGDLDIKVHFFDIADNKKIQPTRAEKPQERWTSAPLDWKEGEETLEIRYHMPTLTQEELTAYGDLKYYGYTAALYYKGEPMDCHASPNVLFLIEMVNQMRATPNPLDYPYYGDHGEPGVLPQKDFGDSPPIDAEPAYKSNIMGDSSLLPP